jgi:hypothetical protein
MNIPRIVFPVFLTIAPGAGGIAATPADGSDTTPLATSNIDAVRDGVSSPTTTQK